MHIWASVGRNGKNIRSDVLLVQRLLLDCIGTYGPLRPFEPDGICGPITVETITQFQRNAVRLHLPDGRMDPGGKSFRLLSARAAPAQPTDAPQTPSPGPPPIAQPPGPPAVGLSAAGLAFIARKEGKVLKLYNDSARLATIGYGHLVHRGAVGTNPAAEAPYKGGISEAQAVDLLRKDAGIHVASVRSAVRVPLTQYQFDALVSLSFNIGGGGLKSSSLVRIINQGGATPDQIKDAFCLWRKVAGADDMNLLSRRKQEAIIFNDNRYP